VAPVTADDPQPPADAAGPHEPAPPGQPVWSAQNAETEPDARFTLANQRTFLAWSRTALALVAAGLGIVQLLPPFPGVRWGRHVIGVPLIVLGAVTAAQAYREWARTQRALRRREALPRSALPLVLAATIAVIAALAAAVALLSATR
jgi:putative membrane protein